MLNCPVKDYGASGAGVHMDTHAVQAAIDACAQNGGGRVTLEGGRFLCGMIQLKSGVELHLERDAVLLGSTNGLDFPEIRSDFWRVEYAPRFNRRCFIYAENCEGIAITGHGAIDCQGEAYIEPLPPEQARLGLWPYRRRRFPEGFDDEGSQGLTESQRSLCSLSPARVVLFMGCRDVLIEDVCMRNQPAGWSYWISDCENVHFHRARIDAPLCYPNNDGIHINCSRDVTVSDCSIRCGDDGIVVRAYSAPLKAPKPCEQVTVSNCNIVSHSAGIRVGWYNDGVIQTCTFSNLTITDSSTGISVYLPDTPLNGRGSDEGIEDTLIQNLSFSGILMDRIYNEPVLVRVFERNRCEGVRDLFFSGIHARSVHMPVLCGREDCRLQNIFFTDCHFTQIRRDQIPDQENGPYSSDNQYSLMPCFRCVDNLVLQGTVFHVL